MSYGKMLTCIGVGLVILAIPTSAMASLVNSSHSNIRHPGVVKVQPKTKTGGAVLSNHGSGSGKPDVQDLHFTKQKLPNAGGK